MVGVFWRCAAASAIGLPYLSAIGLPRHATAVLVGVLGVRIPRARTPSATLALGGLEATARATLHALARRVVRRMQFTCAHKLKGFVVQALGRVLGVQGVGDHTHAPAAAGSTLSFEKPLAPSPSLHSALVLEPVTRRVSVVVRNEGRRCHRRARDVMLRRRGQAMGVALGWGWGGVGSRLERTMERTCGVRPRRGQAVRVGGWRRCVPCCRVVHGGAGVVCAWRARVPNACPPHHLHQWSRRAPPDPPSCWPQLRRVQLPSCPPVLPSCPP